MDQNLNTEKRLPMERVLYEVKKIIVGQDHLLERMVVALLARGHILVEGVPGLAKTMAIKTLAESIGGEFKRIQFTPDLVPADLIGTRIYNQKTGEFNTSLGPVFTNLLLADEINRAPAKVQSALLVMQERQVTIGRDLQCPTFSLPRRIPSKPKAPTRCPRRRSIASCSKCWSAIPPRPKNSSSSSA
jgi:MoxR-like ATPase